MAIPWQIAQGWQWRPWRRLWLLTKSTDDTSQAAAPTHVLPFEAFVQHHERIILNYLWRMTGDEQSAYDLTQETFLRAWERYAKVGQYQHPRAWLFRVATNLALSLRARRHGAVGLAVPLDAQNDPGASDPARHVVEREMVRLTLQTLAPKQRAMLVLREVYGLNISEIADILEMSQAAVKMALYRAREQFRLTYEREEQQS